jgi:hypothetical protein
MKLAWFGMELGGFLEIRTVETRTLVSVETRTVVPCTSCPSITPNVANNQDRLQDRLRTQQGKLLGMAR